MTGTGKIKPTKTGKLKPTLTKQDKTRVLVGWFT